ncbi:hypothetical protein Pcaca04_03510 [Pectobacterium carotovorum subsp. carotovorum]|uniref:hypothetical protein n=1 Tax=Pectobacterium actinidiae TaxID=1507808 RepID=UPI0024A555C4|nr:hypothetical protein Pcaca04_03510 [Pectobacterium carotovorum subsp. carotovorum]
MFENDETTEDGKNCGGMLVNIVILFDGFLFSGQMRNGKKSRGAGAPRDKVESR